MIHTFTADHNATTQATCAVLELEGQWTNLFCWISDRVCPFEETDQLIEKASALLQA